MDDYSRYIHKSRYARWIESENRREEWEETVQRYINFMSTHYPTMEGWLEKEAKPMIVNMDVMPSMRAMMTAGKAAEKDNVAIYNCAFRAVDDLRAFDEAMYILMCGTGVGFSVEQQWVRNLPVVADEFHESDTTIIVPDSKVGWAKSFRELISMLVNGQIPKWDLSRVRPAGARLKTFGGRASGPQPLDDLFKFAVNLFKQAAGRKLTSLECHDLMCKVADIVVVGGVRRSALISLSDLGDDQMRHAKDGMFWEQNPHRALANNSAVYDGKPDMGTFMREWVALYESKSGERGIFNRKAAQDQAEKYGREIREFGTNPCGEIILRSGQFCNLTEVVIRPEDTQKTLMRKVEVATVLGTLQAGFTDFRYLSKKWKTNSEEERLLGVSLTGILDNPLTGTVCEETAQMLGRLRLHARETNKRIAEHLGMEVSKMITTVKPSGTVSQLVNSASGIHPRFSQYYIRSVRADNKDPLTVFLKEQGVPNEPAIGSEENVTIFYFPIKSPENAQFRDDLTALDQLELWKQYREYWTEHNPSITVYVREHEWMEVGQWVWENFDSIGGLSFLPYDGGVYPQAPYREVTKEEYEEALGNFPKIDWSKFIETDDSTVNTKELACTAGVCEI